MTMKSAQGNKKLHMKKIHLFHFSFMRPCITKVNTLTFNKGKYIKKIFEVSQMMSTPSPLSRTCDIAFCKHYIVHVPYYLPLPKNTLLQWMPSVHFLNN